MTSLPGGSTRSLSQRTLRQLVSDLAGKLESLEQELPGLRAHNQALQEQVEMRLDNQALKDEIARLKNLPPRLPFKPSGNPISVRLATILGIGPIVASCLSASVPDAGLFRGSGEFAAYLGLVPRQHSTGGKLRLGSISKMGNRNLRKLLVVGAHAALSSMKSGKTRTALADWARSLLAKKPFKVVAVALLKQAGPHFQETN